MCVCAQKREENPRSGSPDPPPSASLVLKILSEIQLAFISYTLSLLTLASTQV